MFGLILEGSQGLVTLDVKDQPVGTQGNIYSLWPAGLNLHLLVSNLLQLPFIF